MMLQGPVGSPYPGKYVMFVFSAFFAFMTWRFSRSAINVRREQKNNAEQGISVKTYSKKTVGAAVVAAIKFFFATHTYTRCNLHRMAEIATDARAVQSPANRNLRTILDLNVFLGDYSPES
jgi:hypothetical protein